jgi:hypothetical protein
MSSFYGNVFYEIANAFSSILVYKTFGATAAEELKALGTGGSFGFTPLNKWITLDVDSKNYLCKIGHNTIEKAENIVPFGVSNKTDITPINLSAGTIIAVPTLI